MEKIKLVVWDLDETFWKGTLSEGEVTIIKQHVDIVKKLAQRGIMNSISSKNDYEQARKKLIEADVWNYFIFPSINWNPKGENVKRLIDYCQLRSPNVLFIDDNVSNRKEVEHYNPQINTISENEISRLLDMPELKGKDDKKLSRLKQYKILEEKAKVKETYSDNITFLRDSEIQISFIKNVSEYRERILELINRTNQLNFTKIRLNDSAVDDMLNNPSRENVCVRVKDKFGDYGICGFYSLNLIDNKLEHFLFSCRILNLGIETYIYKKLGNPLIDIVSPVAGVLDDETPIDWISETRNEKNVEATLGQQNGKLRVLLLGGCDLGQMCHYIDNKRFEIIKEFNYPNNRGIPIHREHTQLLKIAGECSQDEIQEITKIPFCDEKMFRTILFSGDYDVLVYSVLMNYSQNLFKHCSGKWYLTYGGYNSSTEEVLNRLPMSVEERESFLQSYEFVGQQTTSDFYKDLEWLYSIVKDKSIIFINGSEVDDFNQSELGACARHKSMNSILDTFVKSHTNCQLLDMREIVSSRNDCKDNLRHYQRPIYVKMAKQLMCLLAGEKVNVPIIELVKDYLRMIRRKIHI